MDRKTADYIHNLMGEYNERLNESTVMVRQNCTEDELEAYLKPISHIMALTFDVLDQVYAQHPELKPEKW